MVQKSQYPFEMEIPFFIGIIYTCFLNY